MASAAALPSPPVTGALIVASFAFALNCAQAKPPEKHGRHFVTSYSATVPGVSVSLPHSAVELPERITLVIDNGRVSSILISINESGLN